MNRYLGRGGGYVVINAGNARMGGNLVFYRQLVPRLVAALQSDGMAAEVIPPSGLVAGQMRAAPRALRAAAVFSIANTPLFATVAPQLLAIRDRLLVASAGEPGRQGRRERLRRAALRSGMRHSEVWVVPSHAMAKALRAYAEEQGVEQKRLEVIPHGRPTWRVGPPPPSRSFRILYPAHSAQHKNVLTLIRAVAIMPEEVRPRLTLTMAPHDLAAGKRLADWAGQLAPDRVEFRGPVPGAAMRSLYEEHDVVAFPSLSESFGQPLVEAMHARRPVVASALPYAEELCGPHALYASPSQPGQWATALSEIASSSGACLPTPTDTSLSRFSWDAAAERYAELLRQLSGGAKRRIRAVR